MKLWRSGIVRFAALLACLQVTFAAVPIPPESINIGIIGDNSFGTAWTTAIAIAEINASPDILPRTKLNFTYMESGMINAPDPVGMVTRMNRLLQDNPVGTIGALFSDDSKQQAWMTESLHIPQISWGSVLGDFSSKGLYPYFSRVVPDSNSQVQQIAALCLAHNWRKVAVVYTGDATGASMFVAFGKIAKARGIRIIASTIFVDSSASQSDLDYGMQVLAASSARVFIDFAFFLGLRTDLTRAQIKAGLREPGIQWIVSHSGLSMLDPSLLPVIAGQISFAIAPVTNRPVWIDLKGKIQSYSPDPSPEIDAMKGMPYTKDQAINPRSALFQCQFYDAIKLMAFALHDLYEVRGFVGNSTAHGIALNDAIRRQHFDGCQAYIRLDSKGDFLVPWSAVQTPYPGTNSSGIGTFVLTDSSQPTMFTFVPSAENPYIWYNGIVPLDTLPRKIYQNSVSVRYGMVGATIALMSIITITMIFLAFYRSTPAIKATSYPFTQLSLLGALVIASSVIARMLIVNSSSLRTIDNQPIILNDEGQIANQDLDWQPAAKSAALAEQYLINVGYYLLVGSLLVKTWRISRIFNAKKIAQAQNTSDEILAIVLLSLILGEIAVMIGLQYGDEFKFDFEQHNDTTDIHHLSRSHGDTQVAFPIIYVFRFLILVPTCVFTVRVRNIPAAFNEALQLLVTVYNLAFMSILLPIIEVTVDQSTDVALIAHGVVVFFIVASTSAILTVPKLLLLHGLSTPALSTIPKREMNLNGQVEVKIPSMTNSSSMVQQSACHPFRQPNERPPNNTRNLSNSNNNNQKTTSTGQPQKQQSSMILGARKSSLSPPLPPPSSAQPEPQITPLPSSQEGTSSIEMALSPSDIHLTERPSSMDDTQ